MQGKSMVTARKAGPKGKISHMTVTPADNGGASVETHFHAPPHKQGMGYTPPPKSHMAAFAKHKDAVKHVGSMLGAMDPAQSGSGSMPGTDTAGMGAVPGDNSQDN